MSKELPRIIPITVTATKINLRSLDTKCTSGYDISQACSAIQTNPAADTDIFTDHMKPLHTRIQT